MSHLLHGVLSKLKAGYAEAVCRVLHESAVCTSRVVVDGVLCVLEQVAPEKATTTNQEDDQCMIAASKPNIAVAPTTASQV